MSYNLLAETLRPLDWAVLRERLKPHLRCVEIFPIPGFDEQKPDAVGLSIPAKGASEESWREACQIARILREEFAMKVFDLHTSSEILPGTEEEFRQSFIG
jgi:hypothetical protein